MGHMGSSFTELSWIELPVKTNEYLSAVGNEYLSTPQKPVCC